MTSSAAANNTIAIYTPQTVFREHVTDFMPQHGKQGWTVLFPRGEQRPQDTLLVVTAEGVELSRGSVLDPLVADAQRVYGHLAAAGIEKCRDGLADAPAQGTVLDRDHMAELGTDLGQQGFVERSPTPRPYLREASVPGRRAAPRRERPATDVPHRCRAGSGS